MYECPNESIGRDFEKCWPEIQRNEAIAHVNFKKMIEVHQK